MRGLIKNPQNPAPSPSSCSTISNPQNYRAPSARGIESRRLRLLGRYIRRRSVYSGIVLWVRDKGDGWLGNRLVSFFPIDLWRLELCEGEVTGEGQAKQKASASFSGPRIRISTTILASPTVFFLETTSMLLRLYLLMNDEINTPAIRTNFICQSDGFRTRIWCGIAVEPGLPSGSCAA